MQIAGFDIQIKRKNIRNMRLTIKVDGTIYLSVPLLVSDAKAEAFVRSKTDWLKRISDKMQAMREQCLNTTLPRLSRTEAQAFMQATEAQAEEWRRRMQAPEVTWRWRQMRRAWGICSYAHTPPVITFNKRLAFLPPELTELVIVHELSHLFHRNHSPRFHEHVRRYLPDEREREKQLKTFIPLLRGQQQGIG